jgi:hypothetical protein
MGRPLLDNGEGKSYHCCFFFSFLIVHEQHLGLDVILDTA